MLANEGLALGGFAADTMHMARLWDSSLSKANSAMAAAARAAAAEASGADAPAAAAFATAPRDGGGADEDGDEDEDEEGAAASGYSLASLTSALLPRMAKRPMKELFGVAKTKRDGSQSKVSVLPDTLELQQQAASRARFIEYSAHDARATWHLRNELDRRLRGMKWGVSAANGGASATMSEYYDEFIRPFGELLAEIEATGFKVSVERLPAVQQQAEAALGEAERTFRAWAGQQCPHARYMNIGSSAQLSQLLFAPRRAASASGRAPPPELLLPPTTLKSLCEWVPAEVVVQVLGEARAATLADAAADGASALLGGGAEFGGAYAEPPRAVGRPVVGPAKRGPKALALPLSRAFKVEITDEMRATMVAEVDALEGRLVEAARARNCAVPSPAKLAAARDKAIRALARRKHTEIWLSGLGVPAPKLTKAGTPSTSAAVLSELVKSGVVRAHVELAQGAAAAAEAEVALGALMEVSALETMLASFIRPLQELPDRAGRVHSSLNLTTETGRLSSRCPNLQNQPALEKDRFLIRDMFTCEPGNALIVADYEQLELRLLAHMTDCRSMLEAFRLGGDFHSRTAMGMYPEIRAKVERGELLIERERNADGTVVDATKEVPLIKDACANERKKAKVLNFSIAYGKTARGYGARACARERARERGRRATARRPPRSAAPESSACSARETDLAVLRATALGVTAFARLLAAALTATSARLAPPACAHLRLPSPPPLAPHACARLRAQARAGLEGDRRGGRGDARALVRGPSRGAQVAGGDHRDGDAHGLRQDLLRKVPEAAGHPQQVARRALAQQARRDQHARAGDGGGRRDDRDDQGAHCPPARATRLSTRALCRATLALTAVGTR
jgi:DNA polymerase-1